MKELRWYAEYEGNAIRENLLRTFLLPVVSCDSRSSSVSLTSSSFQRACKGLRKVCMGWSEAWGVGGGKGGGWIRRDLSAILQMCVALFSKS